MYQRVFVNEWIGLGEYNVDDNVNDNVDHNIKIQLRIIGDSAIDTAKINLRIKNGIANSYRNYYKDHYCKHDFNNMYKLRYINGKLLILFKIDHDYILTINDKQIIFYVDNIQTKLIDQIEDLKARIDLMDFWIKKMN
jgi:hypothetical protein